jgi:hypothetical protein
MTVPNDFRKATAEDFADPVPFDLVVGQCVLLHPCTSPIWRPLFY